MTLLELIIKALEEPHPPAEPSKFPISFSGDPILLNLKPDSTSSNPDPSALVQPLTGFQLSDTDSFIADANSKIYRMLMRKLKNPNSVSKSNFIGMLNSFLENIMDKVGITIGTKGSGVSYTGKLIENLGCFVGRDVMGLVIEGCVELEIWELLETLIVNQLVDHGFRSNLVYNLVVKSRSELLCLCIRYFSDLKSLDLCRILRYLLSPSKGASKTMVGVRKEWEGDASLAMEKATDGKLGGKKMELAKAAAELLMLAYDGFVESELCLHYLFASSEVDEVVFSHAVSRLNVDETMLLVRYLGKWLRKYERFPKVIPCAEEAAELKLKSCQWVPTLEGVLKSLEVVLDVHFFSLSLHVEFQEELKALEELMSGLASEGRFLCSLANVIEVLKPEVVAV